jgi:alkylated DNA repair dioxygenase AlkB
MTNETYNYYDSFLDQKEAYEAYGVLARELEWLRHDKVPRSEYFVSRIGKPYAYGVAPYTRIYNPQKTHPSIEAIWNLLPSMTKTERNFDVCFLNRYVNGSDHLGWHADDSPEMDDSFPIAVVTLMEVPKQSREIWFRKRPTLTGGAEPIIEKLTLGHGSCLLMPPGRQDTHQHRIPKASFQCQGRISLTFRGYVGVNS